MSWDERVELYQKIEAHRKRPLIVYVTSKRLGASAMMSSDALPQIIEHLDALPEGSKALAMAMLRQQPKESSTKNVLQLLTEFLHKPSCILTKPAIRLITARCGPEFYFTTPNIVPRLPWIPAAASPR